jgi:pSer/pThr/pTyr-binding forkhead associated (FHA) protein
VKLSVSKRKQQIQKIDLSSEVLEFDYSETVFLIGRSKDCHVVLDDKQISREHSKLVHKNGNWSVVLLAEDSLPLVLNGEEIRKSELVIGDVITIGQFSISIDDFDETPVTTEVVKENVPEPKIVEKVEVVVPKPVIEDPDKSFTMGNSNDDATKEIDISEYTKEIETPLAEDNSTGEMVIESEAPAPIEAADEFNFDDSPGETFESAPEASLSGQDIITENAADESVYSLENIDDSGGDDSTKVIQSFSAVHLELFGETAPYDKFILDKDKTYIGRDPAKCQIILNDPEVSSVHAVIVKNNIMITLEDLNSGNGTLLNGARVNKNQLSHNDEFIIGGVTFTIKFRSEFLQEEQARLMPVDENQSVEVEEIVEVPVEEDENVSFNALGEIEEAPPEEKSVIKRIWKDEQKRKKAIYVVVALVLGWFMLDEDKPAPPKVQKTSTTESKEKSIKKSSSNDKKVKLTEEQKRKFSEIFQIGKNHFDNGRYREALEQFDIITAVDPFYNSSLPSLVATAKEGLRRLEEQERKRREEEALVERKLKIQQLLVEARKYTEEHNMDLANEAFQKITALDPENYEVGVLKRNLKAWDDDKKRKELEETQKKSERERKVKLLTPGKNLFISKNYYQAVAKLTDFLQVSPMDEDLIAEATEMMKKSKEEISAAVNPLLGKAKSLQEGQDLKGAYEVYMQVLKFEPSNAEALNQTNEIKEQLTIKARKIYREAIISESLSLFQDAKEKFQEVQQISPVDSDYYKKATDKLKDYLE